MHPNLEPMDGPDPPPQPLLNLHIVFERLLHFASFTDPPHHPSSMDWRPQSSFPLPVMVPNCPRAKPRATGYRIACQTWGMHACFWRPSPADLT